MDHSNHGFDGCDQSLSSCDNDSNTPSSGWGSGFSLWEEQCFREVEDSADQERHIASEKEAVSQRLWLLFQASACSVAQLYKDRAHGTQPQSLWLPFQVAASNVTTMYRESVESQKKMADLCVQTGMQRRNREMLSWVKKRKRGLIRPEELIAFVCGKNSSSSGGGRERHHLSSGRSARRVTSESLTGASASPFTPNVISPTEHRLHHSRSPPQTFSCLSLTDSAVSPPGCGTDDTDGTDLQPFRDALALSSLTTTATATTGRRNRVFAQFSPNAGDLEELNAFISEEFTRNVDSKKRSYPANDVVMSSPTHKKPKFL